MSKSLLIALLLFAFNGVGLAQANTANNQQDNDPCARFKMRVVQPPENLDPKIVIQVDANLDQAMVVNPCPATPLTAGRLQLIFPTESEQKQHAVSPPLRFKLPDSKLKSPSEVLKQFSVAPKPNRK